MRRIRRRTKIIGGILLIAVSAILFVVSSGLLMAAALIGGTAGFVLFGHGMAEGSPLGYFEEGDS